MCARILNRTVLSVAIAFIVINGFTSSSAQPGLPPAPPKAQLTQPALPSEADREPGYLGLIGDDRGDQGRGVRVVRVADGTPAEEAGLAVGDLIVAIDGKSVGSVEALAAQLRPQPAGKTLQFEVRRGDETQTIDVTLGVRPPPQARPFEFGRLPEGAAEPPGVVPPADVAPPQPAPPRGQLLGVRTGVVTEGVQQRLRLPRAAGARVVSRVVGSPADQAGLPLDSVIVAVDDQPVTSPVDLARLIEAVGPGKEVELTYYAEGERRTVRIPLAAFGARPVDPRAAARPLEPQRPPFDYAERIEQLERHISELEKRVQELERAQSAGGR
jgi:S1-C subfamily serine protease